MTKPESWQISRRLWACCAAALLAFMCLTMLLAARHLSQTTDEADHLYSGYEYWKHRDFGRNPEHPPLAKLLAALPVLAMHPKEPVYGDQPRTKLQDYTGGVQFVYRGGVNADFMLLRARMMVALLMLALGATVLLAATEMFGRATGLVALTLFVLEPVLLANGPLVTTDAGVSCMLFASVYAFYRYLEPPVWWLLGICGLFTGFTLAAKHSGLVLLPTLFLLALVDATPQRPYRVRGLGSSFSRAFAANALRRLGAVCAIAAIGYVVLWAFYGFRFAARPGSLVLAPDLAHFSQQLSNRFAPKSSAAWAATVSSRRVTYMDGRTSSASPAGRLC